MDVWTLTDEVGLRQRYKSCQDRGATEPYSAAMALTTFRSYIRDSVNSEAAKRIPLENKRFKMALGSDATLMLQRLGFEYEPPQSGQAHAHWRLPGPGPFLTQEQKTLLGDVFDELTVLLQQRPDAEKLKIGEPAYRPPPGMKDIERVLGCQDYERYTPATRGAQPQSKDSQAYAGLGALPDFSDRLVEFCADRQIMYDPDDVPKYFQNLRDIAASRQSEKLVAKASLLESQGFVAQAEVQQAYEFFGINVEEQESYPDQQLLDLYRSRIPDLGRDQRAAAKQALAKIAHLRNSNMLKNATADSKSSSKHTLVDSNPSMSGVMSQQDTMLDQHYIAEETDRLVAEMETYEQALAYLDAHDDTPDDFIISIASLKQSEDDVAKKLVPKALEIIAEKRNSDVLRAEARTPGSGNITAQMTPQHAYALLSVENPDLVEDDTIITSHTIKLEDAPGRASELNEALAVIAKARKSEHLAMMASSLSGTAVYVGPAGGQGHSNMPLNEPRGLNNIGNTCYLNSLLQYLFTVKPVRDMVEHFNDFKETLPDDQVTWGKKVADMKVDRAGVQRTQAFVGQLSKLFETLTTTRSFCATPEVELARLTLEKAIAAKADVTADSESKSPLLTEKMRRRSTISGPGLSLARTRSASSGNILNSPPPQRHDNPMREASASPPKKLRTDSMNSAATTIVVEENESPKNDVEMTDAKTIASAPRQEDTLEGLEDAQSHQENAKQEPNGQITGTIDLTQDAQKVVKDQPPPIPPRPTNKAQIEEYAMQQDVQEVMGNVLHQLQWAIKPRQITKFGNQEDIVSDSFWGLITEHSTAANGKKETVSQDFNVLPAYVNEPCDIYDALSATFDREVWDDRTAYWTLDKAPPIMQFQIPRVGFNSEKKVEERNVNQCKLPQYIYLDRYMANEEVLRKRELFWRYRDTLKQKKTAREQLKPREKDQSVNESLSSLSDYLHSLKEGEDDLGLDLPVDEPELHESLNAEAKHAQSQLSDLDHEIEELQDRMNDVFSKTNGQHKYGLQAVFVHRGSTRSGHWYTYMYDPRGDKWRKYNDEDIEVISAPRVQDEIYAPNEAVRGTTALVVYALESEWQQLFDPVHRDPEPEPEPQPGASWVVDGVQPVRSQMSEMPPANVPRGDEALGNREVWDQNRQVADSAVKW
ncbi:MAG: hypothetical protein Q9162_007663 [Coniocarpon cinnabarinum]